MEKNKQSSKGYSKMKVFNKKVMELFSMTPEEHLLSVDDNDINDAYPLNPIKVEEMLVGRSELLNKCLSHLSLPGRHLAVYGHRGIGKTSFSNVIQNFYKSDSVVFDETIYKACSETTTLMDLFGDLVWKTNSDYFKSTYVEKKKKGWSFGLSNLFRIIKLYFKRNNEEEQTYTINKGSLTPAKIAESLYRLKILIVIDELERVKKSNELCFELADLMKKLSDRESNFKIICVGIAKSKNQLFRGHGSLLRQTEPIHLKPVKDLSKIFKIGQKKSGIDVRKEVRTKILKNSGGFPYFVKLQAFHSLKVAKGEGKRIINEDIYRRAIANLINNQDDSVIDVLEKIKRYEKDEILIPILFLAAKIESYKFKAADIQLKYEDYFDEILSLHEINDRLKILSVDGEYNILLIENEDYYFFKNIRDKIYLNIMSYTTFNNSISIEKNDIKMLSRYLKKMGVKMIDRENIEIYVKKIIYGVKMKDSKIITEIHNLIDELVYLDTQVRSNIHSSVTNFINSEFK